MRYKSNKKIQSAERAWRRRGRCAVYTLLSAAMVCALSGSSNVAWQDVQGLQAAAMQGHILLLHDDCHRAVDDPSSVNRYSFKTYNQYVNYCVERRLRDAAKPYLKPRLA